MPVPISPTAARMFQGWHMGMLDLDDRSDLDPSLFHGFRRDAERAANSIEAQRRSLELLRDFKRHLDSAPDGRSADGLERRPGESNAGRASRGNRDSLSVDGTPARLPRLRPTRSDRDRHEDLANL